jgi:hypothetical protein
MALTGAEKQARYRARQAVKARERGALVQSTSNAMSAVDVARLFNLQVTPDHEVAALRARAAAEGALDDPDDEIDQRLDEWGEPV